MKNCMNVPTNVAKASKAEDDKLDSTKSNRKLSKLPNSLPKV